MKIFNFIVARFKSFLPALQGLTHIIKTEKNSWVHLLATFTAISLIFILQLNYIESLFFISAIFFVWITEIFNTVIEYTLDFIHPENNKYIKIIKDASAAAVLLAAAYAMIIALIIMINYFTSR